MQRSSVKKKIEARFISEELNYAAKVNILHEFLRQFPLKRHEKSIKYL